MRFNIHSLPIEKINILDTTFQITTQTSLDDLLKSIQALGMLHPPVLLEKDSEMVIVSGFRRIKACRQLGLDKIRVNVLEPTHPLLHTVQLAIADNASQRPLNLIEMSRAFNLLASSVTEPDEMLKIVSVLGLPKNVDFIEKVKILEGLAPDIQLGLLEESIALSMALDLGKYDAEVGGALAKLFRILNLSLNKQREILGLIADIAGRDSEPIEKILSRRPIARILRSSELDRNQKVHQLRRYLKQCRYPELSKIEEQFNTMVSKLGLGQGIKLVPSRYFEGSHYTLNITFRTQHELSQRIRSAEVMLHDEELKKFLES